MPQAAQELACQIRLIKADGVERDRTSLNIPSDFFYDRERGEYTAKSDVTLHGP
jgi:hypothetical protein